MIVMNFLAFMLACAALAIYTALNKSSLTKQPLSIASVYLFSFLIFYFIDTTYTTFAYDESFRISNITFTYLEHNVTEVWLFYISCAAVTLSIFSYKQKETNRRIQQRFNELGEQNFTQTPLAITFAAVLISLGVLLSQVATIGYVNYFGNLAIRSELFSETTIQNALISTVISTYALIVALWQIRKKRKLITALLLLPVIALALLTGARAALVEIAFIFVFVHSYTRNNITINWKTLTFLCITVIALIYIASNTRIHADTDLKGPLAMTFESEQVPQSENGINIINTNYKPMTNTLIQGFASFIPRQLLEKTGLEKGDGGNAAYTANFVPYRWHDQNSQISLGGLNEVLMNMGWLGVAYIAAIATLIKITIDLLTKNRYTALCIPALTWSAFQFLRGDTYHTINKLFTFIIGIAFIYLIIQIYLTLKRASHG